VTVAVDNDENSQIALVPGDDPDIDLSTAGELQLDLTGDNGEGVNVNSEYVWGDPNDPANDHAFKIVNNDDQSYMLKMNYFFENTGWISNSGQGQSHLNFEIFDGTGSSSARDYPDQRNYNRDYSLGMPRGSAFGSNTGSYRFNPGEEFYVVVTVDTTGPNASTSDDLTGTANFELGDSTSSDSWYPDNPPN
jgi:hypothetical protein